MKHVILVALFLVGFSAFASTIPVASVQLTKIAQSYLPAELNNIQKHLPFAVQNYGKIWNEIVDQNYLDVTLEANKSLGRAWVSVKRKTDEPFNSGIWFRPAYSYLSGLVSNLEGRWLVDGLTYDAASNKILYKGQDASGAKLNLAIENLQIDNGFERDEAPVEVVTMDL